MALLTDGLCGSTCALFMNRMQSVARVPATGVGGIWEEGPPTSSSFAGGNVISASYMFEVFDAMREEGYKVPEVRCTCSMFFSVCQ